MKTLGAIPATSVALNLPPSPLSLSLSFTLLTTFKRCIPRCRCSTLDMFRSMDSVASGSEPSTSFAAILIAQLWARRSSQNCCDLLIFQVLKSLRSLLIHSWEKLPLSNRRAWSGFARVPETTLRHCNPAWFIVGKCNSRTRFPWHFIYCKDKVHANCYRAFHSEHLFHRDQR